MPFENDILYSTLKIILVVTATLGMMCTTTKLKYGTKRILLFFFLYLCYVAVSSVLIISLLGYTFFLRVLLFTISVSAIYLTFLLAEEQPSKSVFNHATQILFSLYITVSITLVNTVTHGSQLTDFLMRLTAYSIIILLEYRFLRRPFLYLSDITRNGWLILAMIPCSLLVFFAVLATYPVPFLENPTGIMFLYVLGAVTIIIYFSIFQYLFIQYRFQTTQQNMELLQIQVENLKEKLEQDAAFTEQSRIDRHDTRHRFQTIACLLESGKTSEALDFITRYDNQLQVKSSVQYCKDILLNATLSSYFGQAKKDGITLETHLSIPDVLPVDSGELSIVIANALENAINACCMLPVEQRIIRFTCIHKPQLMLEISNPCSDEISFTDEGIPLSKDKEHGIGTRSIMAFCKKYNVIYSFSAKNGKFTLRMAL